MSSFLLLVQVWCSVLLAETKLGEGNLQVEFRGTLKDLKKLTGNSAGSWGWGCTS